MHFRISQPTLTNTVFCNTVPDTASVQANLEGLASQTLVGLKVAWLEQKLAGFQNQ